MIKGNVAQILENNFFRNKPQFKKKTPQRKKERERECMHEHQLELVD